MTANNQLKTRRQVSLGGAGANGCLTTSTLNRSTVLLYCTLVYAAAAAKYQQHLDDGDATRTKPFRLARVLQSEGDGAGVEREVRGVWQSAEMSAELETAVSNEFASVLTCADDVTRMDKRTGAKDFGAAMRAASKPQLHVATSPPAAIWTL